MKLKMKLKMFIDKLFYTKEFIHKEQLTNIQRELINKFSLSKDFVYEVIACEICNIKDTKVLFENDRLGIKQKTSICNNCGFMFSNPRMTEVSAQKFYNSDMYRRIYHQKIESNESLFLETIKVLKEHKVLYPKTPNFRKYYKNLYFDFINNEINDYSSVLDIGCGMGLKLLDFQYIGKKAKGIEPSKTFVKAHREMGLETEEGFIKDVKEKYDLVLLTHVFEHLYDLKKSVEMLSEISNKYLFLEVPGHINKMQTIQNAHNYYFSLNTLNFFLLNNKFKLIKIEYDKEKEFIFALYEKISLRNTFSFDKKLEKKLINKIIRRYYFKYYLIKLITNLGLKKIFKFLYNKIKN